MAEKRGNLNIMYVSNSGDKEPNDISSKNEIGLGARCSSFSSVLLGMAKDKILSGDNYMTESEDNKYSRKIKGLDARKIRRFFSNYLNDLVEKGYHVQMFESEIEITFNKSQSTCEKLEKVLDQIKKELSCLHESTEFKVKQNFDYAQLCKEMSKKYNIICEVSERSIKMFSTDKDQIKQAEFYLHQAPMSNKCSESGSEPLTYYFKFKSPNGLVVKVYQKEITRSEVEAIVNAANESLSNGAGVAAAISTNAGAEFELACRNTIEHEGGIQIGNTRVTCAGSLNYKGVIHAVGPKWYLYEDKKSCLLDLKRTVQNIIQTADHCGFKSIAMPPISSGIFGVPLEACAAMYVAGVVEADRLTSLKEIHIIDIKDDVLILIEKFYNDWKENKASLHPRDLVWKGKKESKTFNTLNGKNYFHCKGMDKQTKLEEQKNWLLNSVNNSISKVFCQKKEKTIINIAEKVQVHMFKRDIVECKVDILVSPDYFGDQLQSSVARKVCAQFKINIPKGRRHSPYLIRQSDKKQGNPIIIHLFIDPFSNDHSFRGDELAILRKAVLEVLKSADKRKAVKLAIPMFVAGMLREPEHIRQYSLELWKAFETFAMQPNLHLKEIHVVDVKQSMIASFIDNILTYIAMNCDRQMQLSQKEEKLPAQNKFETWTVPGNRFYEQNGNMHAGQQIIQTMEKFCSPRQNITKEECLICFEVTKEICILDKCRHTFCKDCISKSFLLRPVCPSCFTIYGTIFGNQPIDSEAFVYKDFSGLPGYWGCGTIVIEYHIPDGIQGEDHPNPGTTYKGIKRNAYLPDNVEGRKILWMLKKAFEQRLVFTIGQSRTSGKNDVVTWNDIHHKTRRTGGPERYGYPDSKYLDRVREELILKGITPKESEQGMPSENYGGASY